MNGTPSIVRILGQVARVLSLRLPRSARVRLLKTYVSTFLLKRYDARNRVADINGYRVQFCTYAALAWLFQEIFLEQQYYFVTRKLNPFVIDCGSNIGMAILYFKSLYPDAEILAFEPDEVAFSCLEANVKANKLQHVTLTRKAISNQTGETDFYYDEDDPGSLCMSTRSERMPKQKRLVETTTLSQYVDREVDFLKMDVEGTEQSILEELHHAGKLSHIQQMVIEYHHHIVSDEDAFSKLLELLETSGFGYQVAANMRRPLQGPVFQDVLVYAYRKNCSAC
jgi:FkbM family methyltransferase